jgi:photosystem II stability/assembly factor-like uncharacterized protein
MAVGQDGILYEWQSSNEGKWSRVERNLELNTPLYSIAFNDKLDGIFLSGGQENKGWVIIEKYKDKSTDGKKFAPMQTKGIYTHITYMKSLYNLPGFVVGTNTG